MGIVQSILFSVGCKYFNWRNKRKGLYQEDNGSGSSDTHGLQNQEAGGSTLPIRQEKPKQLKFDFEKSVQGKQIYGYTGRFRLIQGEPDELRRHRLYSGFINPETSSVAFSDVNSCSTMLWEPVIVVPKTNGGDYICEES